MIDRSADEFAYGSIRYAWVVVLILCGLQFVSNMERQILSLAIEPLKQDFSITDIEVSLLQGLAFALFYSIAAIPSGWIADRWNRNRLLMIGMGLWIVATLGCMIAQTYSWLFAARLLVGLADAALLPASFSLLSDYFPRTRLAGAIGAITGATFLGTGASLTFGGLLMGQLPAGERVLLPVFGEVNGWQIAFGLSSVPGLFLIAALFAVREPPRRKATEGENVEAHSNLADVGRYLVHKRGYIGSLIAGIIFLSAFQYGLTNWAVALFIRKFHWTATEIGLLYGLYFMIIGTVASLVGGRLCDWLQARGRRDANFLIPLVATGVLLPAGLLFALSEVSAVSAALLGVITFFVVMSFGPAMAAIPSLAPNSMRAQLIAVTMLLTTLLGAGGGPWLVALLTDKLFGDPQALPYSLAICTVALIVPTAVCFLIGGRVARRNR